MPMTLAALLLLLAATAATAAPAATAVEREVYNDRLAACETPKMHFSTLSMRGEECSDCGGRVKKVGSLVLMYDACETMDIKVMQGVR